VALATLALASCRGESQPLILQHEDAAPLSPAPEQTLQLTASLNPLQSYRYVVKAEGTFEMPTEGVSGDFDLEGETRYVGPDRYYVRLAGGFGSLRFEEEAIEIGDPNWVRTDAEWREGRGSIDVDDFALSTFLEDVDLSELEGVSPKREKALGRHTLHYSLDSTEAGQLSTLAAMWGMPIREDVSERFRLELWLTEKERQPVRLAVYERGS